jgi:hypothetical protein
VLLESLPGEDLEFRPRHTVLQSPPADLTGMIRIGEPVVYDAISLARIEKQPLASEIELLRHKFAFSLVRLPLTIRPTEATTVRFLAVEIDLSCGGSGVTCWSLDPEQVDDEMKVATHIGLNSKLGVKLAEIRATDEEDQEYIVRQPRIASFNAGLTDPAWEFKPTLNTQLRGVQLLHLVVKAPTGRPWKGTASIRADIIYRRMLWNMYAFRRDGRQTVANFAGPTEVPA